MKISSVSRIFNALLNPRPAKRRVARLSLSMNCGENLEERALLAAIDGNDALSEAYNVGNVNDVRNVTGFTIEDNTDVDMFRFTVNAGQRIQFDIDRPSGSLDSYIRLFNSSGTQLVANDDGPTPGESSSLESFIDRTFTTGGTYYLGVSGYGNTTYSPTTGAGDRAGSTGAFTLRMTPVDTNDQRSEAYNLGSLTSTRTATGFSIETATDVDMFRFTVLAGQRIGFDIDRPSGSLDSYIRLFNSSGQLLASNDDGAAPGEQFSFESYLSYRFTFGGTYYLGVSGFGNSTYNSTTGGGDSAGSTGAFTLRAVPQGFALSSPTVATMSPSSMMLGSSNMSTLELEQPSLL